jgi:hypothetical protein
MSHVRTWSLTAAVAGLVATAHGAPALKEKGGAYYATQLGATWVYDHRGEEETLVVTRVATVGDAKVVTVGRRDGQAESGVRMVAVTDRGISIPRADGTDRDPPQFVLKTPVKVKESWEVVVRRDKVFATATVIGVEEVEVPAGKFKAVRVDLDITERVRDREIKSTQSCWYAVGVGLVKTAVGDETICVLKSFAAGKR